MCGYPERFDTGSARSHSKAVHRSYSRKAKVRLPSLESYEKQNLEGASFHCFRLCRIPKETVTRFRRLVKRSVSRNRHSRSAPRKNSSTIFHPANIE